MLKAVFAVDSLTISRYPGTTLDFIAIQQPEFIIYDTPGFNRNNSAQILLDDADLKLIVPQHRIKPVVYQLSGNQTLSIGGLMRVDLIGCLTTSCVCYFSDKLLIHRSKTENAEQLWNEHYGELLVPIIKDKWDKHLRKLTLLNEKFDIAIFGLGWICINGPISEVHVSGCKEIDVIVRKAMI
ncbi:putative protein YqeH [bioreactor metagenome]|uniref:NOA1/YqeH-like C-terminal domain-containing protein n=1 Tax=bioreactor metagenome TaxID=1076179 RepID=A0A645D7J1_9ZZZZ